ncbi:MAG: hypothetical protein ACFFCE_12270 [Promethearchaeota archaeon]
MNTQDFIDHLNQIQKLMQNEKYREALSQIEKLKVIEKESNFNYNLTHRLYQLDSNIHSLYNQQNILKVIAGLSTNHNSISFQKLSKILQKETEINLSTDILKREVEILILRDLIPYKIDGDRLIF